MKSAKIYITIVQLLIGSATSYLPLNGQIDSSLLLKKPADSTGRGMNMDAVYNRPFLNNNSRISVGGYMEANWQHAGTDGVSEGHQFQFRRLTLFLASPISRRVKFLSEIEFEDGGREIAIEFASIDVEFHPLLNLRSGIVLNPIGAFNQNHDGPRWEFTDRPIASTQLLPATWSNAGFGLYGKRYKGAWMMGYEAYITGNFDNSVIDNHLHRTSLPSAKQNPARFESTASGKPLYNAKLAARHNTWGELGFSYMGGVYNSYISDGLSIDVPRTLAVMAVDYNVTIGKKGPTIVSEFSWIWVDVPETYTQQYGNRQQGGFVDVVQPIFAGNILGWQRSKLNLACRLEYVDWNVGSFRETGTRIADELWSVMPGISFRPNAQSVFRFSYRYMQQRDFLGNRPALTGSFVAGVSSYF